MKRILAFIFLLPLAAIGQRTPQAGVEFFGTAAGGGGGGGGGGTVTQVNTGTGLTGGPITNTGTVALSVPVSVANGGTGATSLTAGTVLGGNGTGAVIPLTLGTNLSISGGNTLNASGGGGGGGTVTSVTFTGDGTVLSSTPSSAVTTTGTVTASLNTQSANKVLAGPATGSAASPTFRSLVAADIPTLSYGTVNSITAGSGLSGGTITTSGTISLTNNSMTIAGTSTALGGTISLDTILGLSTGSTGLLKQTAANTLGFAVSGTDYAPATSGTAILAGNGSGGTTGVTIGSGLSYSGGTLAATGGGGGSPAGSNSQVQYNSSGSFGANSGFTSDTSGDVNVLSLISAGEISGTYAVLSSTNNPVLKVTSTNTSGAFTAFFIGSTTTGNSYGVEFRAGTGAGDVNTEWLNASTTIEFGSVAGNGLFAWNTGFNVFAGTATPAGGAAGDVLLFGTTANFGIYYGSGAPTVSAAQGSLYLRSDGSGTTSRLYVNNSSGSGTTWTALTSVL